MGVTNIYEIADQEFLNYDFSGDDEPSVKDSSSSWDWEGDNKLIKTVYFEKDSDFDDESEYSNSVSGQFNVRFDPDTYEVTEVYATLEGDIVGTPYFKFDTMFIPFNKDDNQISSDEPTFGYGP